MVLQREGIRALIKADLEDAIVDIYLKETKEGILEGRRRFLDGIRIEFERIHKTFSEQLGVKEFAPDIDNPGIFESYSKLLEMEQRGKTSTWIEGLGDSANRSLS